MVFLINGKARSGKDTVADYIVQKINAKKIWFAKPLKDMGKKYFGLTDEECSIKKTEFSRRILQGLGSTFREEIDKCFWVNMVNKQILDFYKKCNGDTHFVISDCRYKNEIIELCASYDQDKFANMIDYIGEEAWKNYQIEYYGNVNYLPTSIFDRSLPQIGCSTIKIVRRDLPNIEYNPDHASENDLNNFNFDNLIENNGTLEDLYKKVDILINNII